MQHSLTGAHDTERYVNTREERLKVDSIYSLTLSHPNTDSITAAERWKSRLTRTRKHRELPRNSWQTGEAGCSRTGKLYISQNITRNKDLLTNNSTQTNTAHTG